MVKNILKKRIGSVTFFLIGLVVVLLPVYFISNALGKYDTVAGGDFYQLYEPTKHFSRYFYAWINQIGQGAFNTISPSAPFYYLESFAANTGFTKILNFPLFFLLTLSYISFFYSIKKLSPNISKFWRMALSVFYSYNYLTLSMVTYPWGFTQHCIFYIFIPPILSNYIKFLSDEKFELRTLLIFIIINSLAFIGYSNVAFLLALLIIEFLVGIIVMISRNGRKLNIFKKTLASIVLQLLLFAPYLLSLGVANANNINKVNKTEVFGGNIENWNTATSSTFIKSFIMYPIVGSKLPLIYVYLILPVILLIGIYRNKSKNYKYTIPISILLFLIIFSTKYNNPFEPLIKLFFSFPLPSMLRSPEKMFVFLPFFYIFLISEFLISNKSKIFRIIIGILIVISFSYFLRPSIVEYLILPKGTNSYAINIPGEYKDFSKEVNKKNISTSILSIPYSVKNSINWSNYPKWNFVGHDILHLLFDRNYISANVFDHPILETNFTFRNLWRKPNCCGVDYIEKSFDRFGVEYVIWHKDINRGRLQENAPVYKMLQESVSNGLIKKIEDNEYFEAYQVSENKIQPLIFAEKAQVTFKKINPTKYLVDIKGLKLGDRLVFKQSFNPEWKIYTTNENIDSCFENYQYVTRNALECLSDDDDFVFSDVGYIFKKPLSMEHEMADEYANSWVVNEKTMDVLRSMENGKVNEDDSVDVSLVIYFRSQSLLIIQYVFIAFSIAVPSILLIFLSRKKPKELIK